MATMNTDGQKRAGRFIKANDRLIKHVAVVAYSFEEICPTPMASFDNEDSTIIHARLHTDADLKKTVLVHPKFDQALKSQDGDRFIIKPVDFTPEWSDAISPSTGRRRRIGRGDDAMELSDEGQRQLAMIFGEGDSAGHASPQDFGASSSEAAPSTAATSAVDGWSETAEGAKEASDTPRQEVTSLEREAGSFRINRDEKTKTTAVGSGSFIPLATSGGEGESANTVEKTAAEAWKVRKEMEGEMAKAVAEAKDAAEQEGRKTGQDAGFQEGYQTGFRTGEEKGELGARQTASQFFGRATELIREFESLKGQILDNVQQNFFDLCQAMGEALLEREFEIRPDSFATIMRKAVSETVKGDQFKIRVNPETADAMAKAGIKDLETHLVKDQNIAPWEFRLESQLSVVDVQAKKMVKNLLSQADVTLFAKDDKTGKAS